MGSRRWERACGADVQSSGPDLCIIRYYPTRIRQFCALQGVLLAGFSEGDAVAAAAWMQEMEPGFRVSHSTDDMMNELLATALYDSDTQVCPNLYFKVAYCVEAMDGLTGGMIILVVLLARCPWKGLHGSLNAMMYTFLSSSVHNVQTVYGKAHLNLTPFSGNAHRRLATDNDTNASDLPAEWPVWR